MDLLVEILAPLCFPPLHSYLGKHTLETLYFKHLSVGNRIPSHKVAGSLGSKYWMSCLTYTSSYPQIEPKTAMAMQWFNINTMNLLQSFPVM